jgi:hypothetical protein
VHVVLAGGGFGGSQRREGGSDNRCHLRGQLVGCRMGALVVCAIRVSPTLERLIRKRAVKRRSGRSGHGSLSATRAPRNGAPCVVRASTTQSLPRPWGISSYVTAGREKTASLRSVQRIGTRGPALASDRMLEYAAHLRERSRPPRGRRNSYFRRIPI